MKELLEQRMESCFRCLLCTRPRSLTENYLLQKPRSTRSHLESNSWFPNLLHNKSQSKINFMMIVMKKETLRECLIHLTRALFAQYFRVPLCVCERPKNSNNFHTI